MMFSLSEVISGTLSAFAVAGSSAESTTGSGSVIRFTVLTTPFTSSVMSVCSGSAVSAFALSASVSSAVGIISLSSSFTPSFAIASVSEAEVSGPTG